MKTGPTRLPLFLAAALLVPSGVRAEGPDVATPAPRPIRALLVTGGCCHDYNAQKKIIPEGVSARARVEWTVIQEGGSSTNHRVSIYELPGWADKFDVVVHNECFSDVSDRAFVDRVIAPHRDGLPAVVIHCAMHTFSSMKSDEWREFLGVTTRRHGPQQPLDVKNLVPDHPVMKGFPATWSTGNEELYAIEKVWPETVVLAQAYALDNKKDHAVVWAHHHGKGRVFGTTIAHNNATMSDPVYLDMLTRGLLWSCNKLDDGGRPKPGYGVAKGERAATK